MNKKPLKLKKKKTYSPLIGRTYNQIKGGVVEVDRHKEKQTCVRK